MTISKKSSTATWGLAWCVVAIAIAFVGMSLFRTRLSKAPERVFSIDSLRPSDQLVDSWQPMNAAFDYLRKEHVTPVYTQLFIGEQIKFQYPLSSLLPFYIVRDPVALSTISIFAILIMAVFMVLIFNEFIIAERPERKLGLVPIQEKIFRIALPFAMTLMFYPVIYGYRLGQIQTWLAMGFVIATWLWIRGAFKASGVVLGILTLVKPQFGLILIWAATRKNWSVCWSFLIVVIIGTTAAVLLYGIDNQLDYLKILGMLSRQGEVFYSNQSVNGLLNRFLFNGNELEWTLPPYNPIVHAGTLISSIILMAGALFVPAKHRGGIADFMLAAFTCTIASPVAWTHHYSTLLPLFAALFAWSTIKRPFGRLTLPAVSACYLLLGTNLGGFWNLAHSRLNVIQSYPFFGALGALVILYVWVIRGEPGGKITSQPATESKFLFNNINEPETA